MLHKDLDPKIWAKLPLVVQMANIGSEVIRAMNWKNKRNLPYADLANQRALELFDITLTSTGEAHTLKEITRARELWLDFFMGDNLYAQTEDLWHRYFMAFTFAARNV